MPSRFVVATVIIPVGLIATSMPVNRIMGQYVAGRPVIDGGIEFSGTLFLMELVGWVLTGSAIVISQNHADPATRPFTSPLPMTAAAATLGLAVSGGGLAPGTTPLTTFGFGLGGMVIGALTGFLTARLVLDPADLVVPAGVDYSEIRSRVWRSMRHGWPGVARLGVDPTGVGEWAPSTWASRTSSPSSWHWLISVFIVIQTVLVFGLSSLWATALAAVQVLAWGMGLRIRRLRVAIGPSGVLVSSAIRSTPMVGIDIDRIESVEVIAQDRNLLSRWWRIQGNRLTVATGPGPALLIGLVDGSEILLAMADAESAAVEISRHLP